jgi:hypothetical protein
MFEESVLIERKRQWTMAASFTLESAFVGAVVLLSMLTIERLPNVVLPAPLPPLPAAPAAVEVVATRITRGAASTLTALNTFVEPARIPRAIAAIVDPPATTAPTIYAGGIPNTGLPPDAKAGCVQRRLTLCGPFGTRAMRAQNQTCGFIRAARR